MSNLNWNQIRADFHDANQSMATGAGALSHAGTVFGELRKSILDEEQRAIDNAYREKKFNEDVRQFGLKYALEQDQLRETITANRNREDLLWRGQDIDRENALLNAKVHREAIAQRAKEFEYGKARDAEQAKILNDSLYKYSGLEAKDTHDAWSAQREPLEYRAAQLNNNVTTLKKYMDDTETALYGPAQSGTAVGGPVNSNVVLSQWGSPEQNAMMDQYNEFKKQLPVAQEAADKANKELKAFDAAHPEPPKPQQLPPWMEPKVRQALALTSAGFVPKSDVWDALFNAGLGYESSKGLNQQKHEQREEENKNKPNKNTQPKGQSVSLTSAITHEKKQPLEDDNVQPLTTIGLKALKWASDNGVHITNNELADIIDKVFDVTPNGKYWLRSTLSPIIFGEDTSTKRSSRHSPKALKMYADMNIDDDDRLMKELRRQILELAMAKGHKASK